MSARPAFWRRSIGARLIALFLGLLLALQAASFTALRTILTEHARNELPARLAMGEQLLRELLDRRAQGLTGEARLLATDYGFRAALASDDAPTVASALANHGARIGATVAALLSTDFTLRSSTSEHPEALAPLVRHLVAQAGAGAPVSAIGLIQGLPIQAVLVPVKAPRTVGWVLMGFPLDRALVKDLQGLTRLDLTLALRAPGASAETVGLSSVGDALASSLVVQDRLEPAALPASAAADGWTVVVRGEEFCLRRVALDPARGPGEHPQAGGRPEVTALLSLSVDEAVRLPRDLQLALVVINLAGVVFFALGSIVMARQASGPLRDLAASAERLGAGDYAAPVAGQQRSDEIGELAHAFERMRVNVAGHRAEILRLAYQDPLTGLPNRTHLRDALKEALTDAAVGAVLMLDVDRFQRVNDVLGYEAGNRLLVLIAQRLEGHRGPRDALLARLGGDEFALLMRGVDAAGALALARELAQAVDAPFELGDQRIDVGATIGLACWPAHAQSADALLVRAEMAMAAAKRRGNGPQAYEPGLDVTSAQSLTLLTELRHAVQEGELLLHLQPKLALADRRLVGAEALVRWHHPRRGLVPPGQFIPFAEQTGFVRTLTLWVFEEAARQWGVLREKGILLTLSVNLSTRDLMDADLPAKFAATLQRHRVPTTALCLEITESAMMDDPARALATLETLHEMGLQLSIDDFGTGYSSLAYLKRLPVDELKIDQSFVRQMQTDADDAMIVRSTVDLAHNLGIEVVAEGVEDEAVWQMLRGLGCDHAQGFHLARPMAVPDFLRWAQARAPAAPATLLS